MAIRTSFVAAALLSLGACSTFSLNTDNSGEINDPSNIDSILDSSADRAAMAEDPKFDMSFVREDPQAFVPPPAVDVRDMSRPLTINWNGPAENFLMVLAREAGYGFELRGNRPANPLLVSIISNSEPVLRVAERTAAALRGSARVVLDDENRMIKLEYL